MRKVVLNFRRTSNSPDLEGYVYVEISSPYYREIFQMTPKWMWDYSGGEAMLETLYGERPLPYEGRIWNIIETALIRSAKEGEGSGTLSPTPALGSMLG